MPGGQLKVPAVLVEYLPGGLGVPAKQSSLEEEPIEFVVSPSVGQKEVQVLDVDPVSEVE